LRLMLLLPPCTPLFPYTTLFRSRMRREFGGVAGNIAYNLKLLGGDPVPMATVGQDFGPYREWFVEQGIRLDRVLVIDELFTPQRSEEHTSELQSRENLVCRLLLE